VKAYGWSAELVEDVLKDIILRDAQNRTRIANRAIKANGGQVKRGRKRKLRQGASEQNAFAPNPIPVADPTYGQTKARGRKPGPSQNSKAKRTLPLQVNPDSSAVSANSEALPSGGIVGSTAKKRAGAPPIEATAKDSATIKPASSAPPKKKSKTHDTRHSPGTINPTKENRKRKAKVPSMCIEINNAHFVLHQDLDFTEWSRLLDSVAIVEDCRRKPIYFYRLLDGSVKSVTDAAEYRQFWTDFHEGLLPKDNFDAVHIDRVWSFEI
jgi:hypothetical protein